MLVSRKNLTAYQTNMLNFIMFVVGFMFAFRRTISVVATIDGLKFFAADRAGEHGFFMRDFSLRVNSLVFVFGDKLKVRNVVVVFVEVAVMNIATVGNFAVKVRPNETMKSD